MAKILFIGICSCGQENELVSFSLRPSEAPGREEISRSLERVMETGFFTCASCGQAIRRQKALVQESHTTQLSLPFQISPLFPRQPLPQK